MPSRSRYAVIRQMLVVQFALAAGLAFACGPLSAAEVTVRAEASAPFRVASQWDDERMRRMQQEEARQRQEQAQRAAACQNGCISRGRSCDQTRLYPGQCQRTMDQCLAYCPH